MIERPTYLNLAFDAPGVRQLLDAVVIDDGTIALAPVHGDAVPLGDGLEVGDAALGAAGIGVAPNGDVYLADTDGDRVLRIPACDGPAEPVGCLRSLLQGPRGVLVGPRGALYVADTGHHRILVVDLETEQLRTIWGQPDRYGEPASGSEPGRLDEPWDLAADGRDRVYVVDHGNRRIQRFDADGCVDASFAEALAATTTTPREPEYVVTAVLAGDERLLVFDRVGPRRSRLLVYDLDGALDRNATQTLRRLLLDTAPGLFDVGPAAVATAGASLYVTETATGRVLEFDLAGRFVGFARWHGGAAGLALDSTGRLLVHPGSGAPVALGAGDLATTGSFRIGPFAVTDRPTAWQVVRAELDQAPPDAHVRLYAFATDDPTATPPPLGDPAWRVAPVDAAAWLTDLEPAQCLWVGGRLTSGAGGGPVIRGLCVEFDRPGWLEYLPAIYARESSEFVEPALALLEDALAEQEDKLDRLPLLFDPAAAPADALPWLAGWLAWELEEMLGEPAQRALVARAFELQGRRGTAECLRELARLVLDADVTVTEPASSLRLWQLGEESGRLGSGTMLAAAEPDGAVLDATADLDRSYLQPEEDYGAPVFLATAQRFCVQVYASDLDRAGSRGALERLIERERPAGTEAHLCVVEPRLVVGFQARLGVDAIVGREPQPLRLGVEGLLGHGAALSHTHTPVSTAVGIRLGRIPISTRGAT